MRPTCDSARLQGLRWGTRRWRRPSWPARSRRRSATSGSITGRTCGRCRGRPSSRGSAWSAAWTCPTGAASARSGGGPAAAAAGEGRTPQHKLPVAEWSTNWRSSHWAAGAVPAALGTARVTELSRPVGATARPGLGNSAPTPALPLGVCLVADRVEAICRRASRVWAGMPHELQAECHSSAAIQCCEKALVCLPTPCRSRPLIECPWLCAERQPAALESRAASFASGQPLQDLCSLPSPMQPQGSMALRSPPMAMSLSGGPSLDSAAACAAKSWQGRQGQGFLLLPVRAHHGGVCRDASFQHLRLGIISGGGFSNEESCLPQACEQAADFTCPL